MPRQYFSVELASSLSALAPGASVHVIGVCGVAMAQLAVVLGEMGFKVSGSDKEFYEPMAGLLAASPVKLYRGYNAQNLNSRPDLVVIGNAVSYENPEVQETERLGVAYTLFPKLLFETVINERHSIVVSGTHGKTTTAAMGAFLLQQAGRNPGYFIGGVARDLKSSLHRGTGDVSIVEGDEYDSAFFAKVPKFNFYKPATLIVTSIEFDHADIYADLEAVVAQFDQLVHKLPPGSQVVACIDDPIVRSRIREWRGTSAAEILSYGFDPGADGCISELREERGVQSASFSLHGSSVTLSLRLSGRYNMSNAAAVAMAAMRTGVTLEECARHLSHFAGVKRRQEVRLANARVTLIEDFAHHPTAVRETLAGIRARYPQQRVWAIFEPRSNTSRRKVFQRQYIEAFGQADRTLLCRVEAKTIDRGLELLDVDELAAAIAATGTSCEALPSPDAIHQQLLTQVKPGDVVVVMSNGAFGGLAAKLEASFS